MPIININRSVFASNIEKYAKKPLRRANSPLLSSFLLKICEQIKSNKFEDKDFLMKLSKVHIKMCTHFECLLIYELLRICYNLDPPMDETKKPPESTGIFPENHQPSNITNISFKDCAPKNKDEIKNMLGHLSTNRARAVSSANDSKWDNISSTLATKLCNKTDLWKKSMHKFRKLATKGDIFAKNNKVYDDIHELENKIEKYNDHKKLVSDNLWVKYLTLVRKQEINETKQQEYNKQFDQFHGEFGFALGARGLTPEKINNMIRLKILAEANTLNEKDLLD